MAGLGVVQRVVSADRLDDAGKGRGDTRGGGGNGAGMAVARHGLQVQAEHARGDGRGGDRLQSEVVGKDVSDGKTLGGEGGFNLGDLGGRCAVGRGEIRGRDVVVIGGIAGGLQRGGLRFRGLGAAQREIHGHRKIIADGSLAGRGLRAGGGEFRQHRRRCEREPA